MQTYKIVYDGFRDDEYLRKTYTNKGRGGSLEVCCNVANLLAWGACMDGIEPMQVTCKKLDDERVFVVNAEGGFVLASVWVRKYKQADQVVPGFVID